MKSEKLTAILEGAKFKLKKGGFALKVKQTDMGKEIASYFESGKYFRHEAYVCEDNTTANALCAEGTLLYKATRVVYDMDELELID